MIIVLFGKPGAGKGTQAPLLAAALGVPTLATGDELRAAIRSGSALGLEAKAYMDRGDLVPDEVIVGVIAERIDSAEAEGGFILDGFPRTTPQAEALDAKLAELGRGVTAVLLIDVSDEEVVRRLGGRRTCEAEGHVYHVDFNPPKAEGVCDIDGSRLEIRDDDKPEVVRHRLATYHEKTEPLVAHYEAQALLRRVDGLSPPDEVSDRIRAMLATLRMEEEL